MSTIEFLYKIRGQPARASPKLLPHLDEEQPLYSAIFLWQPRDNEKLI